MMTPTDLWALVDHVHDLSLSRSSEACYEVFVYEAQGALHSSFRPYTSHDALRVAKTPTRYEACSGAIRLYPGPGRACLHVNPFVDPSKKICATSLQQVKDSFDSVCIFEPPPEELLLRMATTTAYRPLARTCLEQLQHIVEEDDRKPCVCVAYRRKNGVKRIYLKEADLAGLPQDAQSRPYELVQLS